jgi:hypothetical protein
MDALLGIMGSAGVQDSDSGRGVELLLACEEDEGSSIVILPKLLYYNSTADCVVEVSHPASSNRALWCVSCQVKSRDGSFG